MKPITPSFTAYIVAGALAAFTLGGCATRTAYTDLYGSPATAASYQPTILIQPGTRYVNVVGGDTIRFIANGKEFAWTFNVARTVNAFELNDVAPPGMLDHPVRAFVAPDPKYFDAP